jgi:circadian clock protein KaiC
MERTSSALKKAPTGIQGLDEIIGGGLPAGRTTLVCGGPGCGKTLLAIEFLVRGAEEFGEPGVFMAFEETAEELAENVASLGIDLNRLIEEKKIFVDFVYIERSEIEETGAYDLEGLFIRLAAAVAEVGAKRVALDTIETIFAGFSDEGLLRSELRRLFRWLNDRDLTAVVTGERGEKSLTRYGLEEYVSDCVILLENRVENKIASRILRVVKYRGSSHGADEYPFLIGDRGIWVQPVTSLGLDYASPLEHISTGVAELDRMLDGRGYYRGSSVLVSGSAGTGKTSLAAALADAACRRGERCLFFAFEEAVGQIIRNMRSIGIDLGQWVEQGNLRFRAARPSLYGLETHLLTMQKLVEEFQPGLVIVDPLTNLAAIASEIEVKAMLVRLIDYLKMKQVTALFTSLTSGSSDEVTSQVGVSSLMDTWILVRNIEQDGERNRGLYVLKARGMAHSAQVREFRLTAEGIQLIDVSVGPQGVLVGSARAAQEARVRAAVSQRQTETTRRRRELDRRRKVIESQIAVLQAEIESAEELFREDLSQVEDDQLSQAGELRALNEARQATGMARSKEG